MAIVHRDIGTAGIGRVDAGLAACCCWEASGSRGAVEAPGLIRPTLLDANIKSSRIWLEMHGNLDTCTDPPSSVDRWPFPPLVPERAGRMS